MTFFAVLLALLAEQLRALPLQNPVIALLRHHAASAERAFEFGKGKHDIFAWLGVVLPWTLFTALIDYALYHIHFILAFAWHVVVLYFTLGFRQLSHHFTDIQRALDNDDVLRARDLLHIWTGLDTAVMPVSEIARHTLIHAIVASHRHVFGVFFWCLLPLGLAGAVLYRVAAYLAHDAWVAPGDSNNAPFSGLAHRIFYLLDWLPVRLTALGFAIVGNFEDAIDGWRNGARQWPDANEGVLLAAGSGALGVRLSGPLAASAGIEALDKNTAKALPLLTPPGESCTPRTLQSAVGLVWRAVILWMLLLFLLTMRAV